MDLYSQASHIEPVIVDPSASVDIVILPHMSNMSDNDPLSSISLKQLAALYVSDAITEENFKQLASKFFPSAALRPPTSGKGFILNSRSSSDAGNLINSTIGNGAGNAQGSKGHLAAFSAGTASPQLRQLPMNDHDRYLFSMDLQNMFVLLRIPNLRESDAIRALACLDPMSVRRCLDQLRRCRSTASEFKAQSRPATPISSRPSSSTDVKYVSPLSVLKCSESSLRRLATPSKSDIRTGALNPSNPQLQAIHAVSRSGVEDSVMFSQRSVNQTKHRGSAGQRPSSAPTSGVARLWKSSANGAPPPKSPFVTERSYALTHRDQVARDVVGAISWLGEVAIDTTSPASLAQRKARKDFRVAHAGQTAILPSERGKHGGHMQLSAKKTGLLSQQSNTTSVVIKALQHGRAKGTQASRNNPRDDRHRVSSQPDSNDAANGSRRCDKWIQSDARFNMHQIRRQLLQQLL
jgi:hypothetical protein